MIAQNIEDDLTSPLVSQQLKDIEAIVNRHDKEILIVMGVCFSLALAISILPLVTKHESR